MLEDTERIARRVLGGAHPVAGEIGEGLKISRAALAACDAQLASESEKLAQDAFRTARAKLEGRSELAATLADMRVTGDKGGRGHDAGS